MTTPAIALRAAAAALLAGALAGQERPAAERAVEERLAVPAVVAGKPSEAAALELAAARAALSGVADAALRASLEQRIVQLAAKVDPVDRVAVAAAADAAARLLAIAGTYEAKGWLTTARDYANTAARLAPEAAAAALLRLDAAIAAANAAAQAADAAGRPALDAWFRSGEPVQGQEDWRFGDDSLMAPSVANTTDAAIFLSGLRARPGQIRFEVDVVGAVTGGAGVILGVRNYDTFLALELKVTGTSLWTALVRQEPKGRTTLHEVRGELPASYASPAAGEPKRLHLAVFVRGQKVEATVGDLKLAAELQAPLYAGMLGLEVWNTGDHAFRPTFAKFVIAAEVR